MRVRYGVPCLLALALASATEVDAQETSKCDLLDNPTRTFRISNEGTPYESWYITEAVFVCEGGRRLVADVATYSVERAQITLTGSVEVDDPQSTLRSEFAQYFVDTEQLHARTNVVLRETRDGSVIRSEQLDIYQETPERESLLIATGGRPRAIMFQQPGTDGGRRADGEALPAAADTLPSFTDTPPSGDRRQLRPLPTRPDSTILDAQEIRITGGHTLRGTGTAVLRRDSMTATGHAIEFGEESGRLHVMGDGVVELPTQQLRGDTIAATVNDQNDIDDVLAIHGASLVAEDLSITAPAIRLMWANDGIERLVAMNWAPPPGASAGARPHVESDAFNLDADSIDVLAPGQQITEAVAIGDARGERVLPDSLQALLPEAAPEVLALLSRDWMRGDTVRARFAPNPAAETDSTASSTIMEQLAAHGQLAQSMYSIRDEDEPDARLSFNYLVSSYIEVNFAAGEVGTVKAAGDARGVYLQPAEAAAAASNGVVGVAETRRRR